MKITELVDGARYSENLESLLWTLDMKEVLRLVYLSDYQGFVDIDALLHDGRVFSYKYYYGSCPGCDEWDNRGLDNQEIEEEMLKESTIFPDLISYQNWRSTINSTSGSNANF